MGGPGARRRHESVLGFHAKPPQPPGIFATYRSSASRENSVQSLTEKPFGVNFLVPFVDPAGVEAAAGRAPVYRRW